MFDVRSETDTGGCEVRESLTQSYDTVAQILHRTSERRWHGGNQEQTRVTRIALRYSSPQEIAVLLHYNGFTIVRQYGDWNREPLTGTSTTIIAVCRKRATQRHRACSMLRKRRSTWAR